MSTRDGVIQVEGPEIMGEEVKEDDSFPWIG